MSDLSAANLVELLAEFNALTPEVEAVKLSAGHGGCDGWTLGGEPYDARCGCGLPLADLVALAAPAVWVER